jgi:hypothetical protein
VALAYALGMRRALLPFALLAGCSTVDLGSDPAPAGQCLPDRQYFADTVWPEYLDSPDPEKSCVVRNGCHDANNGPRSALRLDPAGAPDDNYDAVLPFIRCTDPMTSDLLTKPLANINKHEGKDIFQDTSDPAVVDFLAWFPN